MEKEREKGSLNNLNSDDGELTPQEIDAIWKEGLEFFADISQASVQPEPEENIFDNIIRLLSKVHTADLIGSNFALLFGIYASSSILDGLKKINFKALKFKSINNN